MREKIIGSSTTGWSIQSIEGLELPSIPSGLTHDVYTVERDSYEDINGTIQRPAILGERDKFTLSFPMMYQQQMDDFLNLLRNHEVIIEYEDFWDRSILRTAKFFRSDLFRSPYWIKDDGEVVYNAMSVEFTSATLRTPDVGEE